MKPFETLKVDRGRRPGFTLVELVIVVAVLAIVGVIIVPTVRTLNEDRKVRDTARVVGSVFATARQRAAVDGLAGVEIVSIPSNPGATDGPLRYNAPNMGLVLFELRGVPPYVGDTNGATVTFEFNDFGDGDATTGQWEGRFAGSDVIFAGIQPDDFIEINDLGIRMRILQVNPGPDTSDPTDDFVVVDYPFPNTVNPWPPLLTTAVPFRIFRQPVRIESSALRLPNNLFLNMSLSGHGTAPDVVTTSQDQWRGRQFRDFESSDFTDNADIRASEGATQIWFAQDGSIQLVRSRQFIPDNAPGFRFDSNLVPPTGPIHLLLCNGEGEDVDLTNLGSTAFLDNDDNMWVTVDHRTGAVSTGRTSGINPTDTLLGQLQDSRALALNRRSANP